MTWVQIHTCTRQLVNWIDSPTRQRIEEYLKIHFQILSVRRVDDEYDNQPFLVREIFSWNEEIQFKSLGYKLRCTVSMFFFFFLFSWLCRE